MEYCGVGVMEYLGRAVFHHPRRSINPMLSDWAWRPAAPGFTNWRLRVGVACAEHGGKPRHLLFAAAALAGLLKMPVVACHLQRPFAVNLLLQTPQRPFHRLALFKLILGQLSLTSSPKTSGQPGPSWPRLPFGQAAKHIPATRVVNRQLPPANPRPTPVASNQDAKAARPVRRRRPA